MLCIECGLYFELDKHHNNLVHLNKKEIRCLFCARLFTDIDTMFEHILEHGGSTYCHVCYQRFDNYEYLLDHIDVHTKLHVYGCAKCQLTTGNVLKYLDHNCAENGNSSDHDSGVESTPVTEVSNKDPLLHISAEPKHKETLKFIAKCKNPNGYYTCPQCSRQLTTLRGIRHHLLRHYNLFKFVCEICNRKFPTHSKLKEHELLHNGVKYKCPICQKSFSSKYILNAHSVVHNGGFFCAHCSKKFNSKPRLQLHLTIRKCCGKLYGCSTVYQSHVLLKRHEFFCKYCDQSFRIHRDLNNHVSKHHRNIICTHKCTLCNSLFTSSLNFKRHLRRLHHIKISTLSSNDYKNLWNKP